MKAILFMIVVIGIIGVHSGKPDVDACIAESKVDTKLFKEINDNPNFKGTRELDCFAACLFKKDGVIDDNGNVNPSKIAGVTDDTKECTELRGADSCDTAGKIMGCFFKKGAMHLFHVE